MLDDKHRSKAGPSTINLADKSRNLDRIVEMEKEKQKELDRKHEHQKRVVRKERDQFIAQMEEERVRKRSTDPTDPLRPVLRSRSESHILQTPNASSHPQTLPAASFKLAPLAQYFSHLKRRPERKRSELIPMQSPQPLRFRTDPYFLRKANTIGSISLSAKTSPEAKTNPDSVSPGREAPPRPASELKGGLPSVKRRLDLAAVR
mmetsp:Transcript_21417/g.43596  ORF Transcript_21417/g.43596 Transcript_21417/m.43596 type:complete len:205 (+) Transcript_21417:2-616(+)